MPKRWRRKRATQSDPSCFPLATTARLGLPQLPRPVNELRKAVDGSAQRMLSDASPFIYCGAAGGRHQRDPFRPFTWLIEAGTTMMRRSVIFYASFLLGGLFLLVTAELCLRFLPVATGLPVQTVNADNPVLRFTPKTKFTYSIGWSLAGATKGRINNDGWVNDQDYDPTDTRPLLAIIGDCFIEAQMVPSRDTVQGRLAAMVGAHGRVYSFAASYAGLSQYLIWASYAAAKYKPDGMVINVVAHDFEESFVKYGGYPGRHYFVEGPNGRFELSRIDFIPNPDPLRAIIKRFALTRYLAGNLTGAIHRVLGKAESCPANTCKSPDAQRLVDSQRALSAFLDELPKRASLPTDRILLIVDSIRPEVYTDERAGKETYFGVMRQQLLEEAQRRGYETIDLNPRFAAAYRRDKLPLSLPDGRTHWNSAGHAVVADAVRQSKLFSKVFTKGLTLARPSSDQRDSGNRSVNSLR